MSYNPDERPVCECGREAVRLVNELDPSVGVVTWQVCEEWPKCCEERK